MTYTTASPAEPDWCNIDNAPSAICGGPHVAHVCDGDRLVITLPGDPDCPLCGYRR